MPYGAAISKSVLYVRVYADHYTRKNLKKREREELRNIRREEEVVKSIVKPKSPEIKDNEHKGEDNVPLYACLYLPS